MTTTTKTIAQRIGARFYDDGTRFVRGSVDLEMLAERVAVAVVFDDRRGECFYTFADHSVIVVCGPVWLYDTDLPHWGYGCTCGRIADPSAPQCSC